MSTFSLGIVRKGRNEPGRGGGYSFVASLSQITIDHAPLSRQAGGGWGVYSCEGVTDPQPWRSRKTRFLFLLPSTRAHVS